MAGRLENSLKNSLKNSSTTNRRHGRELKENDGNSKRMKNGIELEELGAGNLKWRSFAEFQLESRPYCCNCSLSEFDRMQHKLKTTNF